MLTFYCFQDLCLPFNFSDRTFRSCPFKWDYIADASFYNESVYLPLYSNGNKKKILGNIGRLGHASAIEGAYIRNLFLLYQDMVIIITFRIKFIARSYSFCNHSIFFVWFNLCPENSRYLSIPQTNFQRLNIRRVSKAVKGQRI